MDSNITLNYVKNEAYTLQKRINELKVKRLKLYRYYKYASTFFKFVNSLLSTLMVLTTVLELDDQTQKIIISLLMVSSCTLWANVDKKAYDYLIDSYDLQTALDLLNTYNIRLKEIQSDGIITLQQETQINNMIVNIDVQLAELTTCSRVFNILMGIAADPDLKNTCKIFMDATKKYNSQQISK